MPALRQSAATSSAVVDVDVEHRRHVGFGMLVEWWAARDSNPEPAD
jgi:hypothetical protein